MSTKIWNNIKRCFDSPDRECVHVKEKKESCEKKSSSITCCCNCWASSIKWPNKAHPKWFFLGDYSASFIISMHKNSAQETRAKQTTEVEWYFVTKIVLTFCDKKNVLVIFWNSRLKAKNFQNFTRTIYSNIERSEQF